MNLSYPYDTVGVVRKENDMLTLTLHPAGMVVRCERCGRVLIGKELSLSAIQVWERAHELDPLPFEL